MSWVVCTIGQMMAPPHLKELHELYEVVALANAPRGNSGYVGDYYGIARGDTRTIGPPEGATSTPSMVLTADSHREVIADALRAKKHVVTEKPMCFAMSEADESSRPTRPAGTVCMVTT